MKLSRSQKKSRLEAYSQELIERLLEWEEQNPTPNLSAIEDEILELRKQFGVGLLSVVLEGQAARQPVSNPQCTCCGQAMRNKGSKARDIGSRLGEIEVERGYYYCKDCQSGLFPPRRATGLEP